MIVEEVRAPTGTGVKRRCASAQGRLDSQLGTNTLYDQFSLMNLLSPSETKCLSRRACIH